MAQEDELALSAALIEARSTSPDEEAQVRSLARALQAPVSAIRNTPAAERPRPPVADITREILTGAPATGRFLTNPDNARIAQDDVRPLSEMEKLLARGQFAGQTLREGRQPANTPLNWLRGIGSAFGDAFSPSGSVAEGSQLALYDLLRASPLGQLRDATGAPLFGEAGRQSQLRDVNRAQAGQEAARPDIQGNIAGGIYGGLTSLARSSPGIVASILTANPAPALALAGTQTSGEAYGRYSARGTTPGQAALGAAGEGAIEVVTELLPMGFLVDAFGATGAKRFLTNSAASLLLDVPGEQLATLAQDAIDTAIANPDKTWADYRAERWDAAAQTFIATITQGALTTGASALARQAVRRADETSAVEADAAGIQAVADTAANSALRARSPETFEDFIGQLAQDGPVENLYVDAQTMAQVLGEQGLAAAIEAVPAIRDQLADALANGSDIQIPVEQFAARLAGTDAAPALLDHLRANPILPSRAEVQALAQGDTTNVVAEAGQIVAAQQVDEAFTASAERVQTSFLDQLNTAGRFSKDVNAAYAGLVSNFYAVQAARLGITPEQMAERYPLKITSEAPGTRPGAATMDQNENVRLVHYSTAPGLLISDPTRWGQNSAATTREERARAADAPGRTYFYDPSVRAQPEGVISATAPYQYEASIPRARLYDFDADPLGLRPEGERNAANGSAYESAIQAAGFAGYLSNATLNGAVAVFDPVGLRATGAIRTPEDAKRVADRTAELSRQWSVDMVKGLVPMGSPKPDFRTQAVQELFETAYAQETAVSEQQAANPDRYAPVEGAPKRVKVGDRRIEFGPFQPARDAAYGYMADRGLTYEPPRQYAQVDTARAERIAAAFDEMAHQPNDPVVRAAYRAMIDETLAQYQAIKATGLEVEFIDMERTGDPYALSPRLAILDVTENNHLWVFPTDDGFGGTASAEVDISGNPLLELTNEWIGDKQLRANDVFRIVHDYFGHIKDGFGFRADGEENAWQSHAAMFSPLARRAMTTETRGQNSWVNYGPFGEFNKTASAGETQYAPQKIGLLPLWVSEEGFLGGAETGTDGSGSTYFQSDVPANPPFFSALARAVGESKTTKAPAAQWKATLSKTAGVKKDEIEWSGLNEWLDDPRTQDGEPLTDAKGNIPREAVLAFLQNGGVQLDEVVLGAAQIDTENPYYSRAVERAIEDAATAEDAVLQLENDGEAHAAVQRRLQSSPRLQDDNGELREDWAEFLVEQLWSPPTDTDGTAQFSQYKLPGADDTYREFLLTLPRIDGPSTHWDEPNVVAHARITTRQDASGAKVLFLEEVQSDWHQKGRDEGYATPAPAAEIAAARAAFQEADAALKAASNALADAGRGVLERALAAQAGTILAEPQMQSERSAAYWANRVETLGERSPAAVKLLHHSLARADSPLADYRTEADKEVAVRYSEASLRATEANRDLRNAEDPSGIPDAPFRTSWAQLVMKRMIRYAVDNGFDKIAWINGNQQNGGQTGGDGSFFYERNLVNLTNEVIKKLGGRVEKIDMVANSPGSPMRDLYEIVQERVAAGEDPGGYGPLESYTRPAQALGIQNGFAITEQMKAQAAEGFALFQRNRGQIAFGNDITQTPSVISLLQTADLSTFLHETGHFFLEVQAHMARQTDAPAEVTADMDTLLSWFGVDNLAAWDALPIEEKRPLHEQFARGFEAYLFEGKAPTAELRGLFQRFRSWLLNVYKTLSALNVTLTDEVRSVMGRMLASAEAVKETEDARALRPLFETKPDYMTAEAWDEYQRSLAAATEEGIDLLETRTARDMQWLSNAKSRALKKLQRTNDEQRKAVKAEVTAEVMAEPVNRARRFLTRGIGDDGEPIDGAGKLDLAKLRQMYGDGEAALWRRLRTGGKFGEAGNDGLDPDAVAEMFGFESGDALVRTMVESEPPQQKIASETDQRMFERYGDVNDEKSLERAANQAVANDARARFVATEMAALAQMTGRPRALAETARTVAAGIVNRLEIKRMRPAQFFAAQARAAKAAERALAKDDLETAATQKRNQLVNLQAARYVLKAQDEVESSLRLFNRIISAKDEALTRSRDMNLVNAARAILAAYGIGRVKNDPISYLDMLSKYDPVLYADLKPWIDGARVDAKPFDQLTFERFQGLRDTVNQLWTLARRTRQMEIDGQLQDLDRLREALGQRLDEIGLPTDPAGPGRAPTDAERFGRMLQGARASLRRVESWARGLDGADTGPFRRTIWNPVSEAADRYRIAQRDYLQKFLDLLKPIEATLTATKIAAPEIGYTFGGRAELLHAILHTGNGSNLSKLLLGRSWGKKNADGSLDTSRWDALLSRLIAEGTLTKADYDFAQSVWDLMDKTKPGAQAAHRAMYGRYFDEVAADEVVTPFGNYRGGYVPALTDAWLVQDAALRAEQEAIEGGDSAMFPAASNGFTKSRVEDYTRELALDLRLLPMHIDKVLKFTHLGPPVRDVSRLLKGRAFSAKLQAFDPVAQTDLLLPWLQRAAKQIVETPTKGAGGKLVDKAFSTIRSRMGMQLMFANVSNTLQQVTGFATMALRVKRSYLRAALWRYIRAPGATAEAVSGLSKYMATRTSGQMFEVRQTIEQLLLNPSKYDELRDFATRHGYFLQSAAQNFVDTVGWSAAYDQAVARGDTDAEAVRFADSVIRETQGSLAPEDVSRVETGIAFIRMFTQFYSYFNMTANLLGTEFQVVARGIGVKKGMGRLLYVYTMGVLIPALGAETIATIFRGGFDDDEDDGYLDELLQWFFGSQLKFGAAMVPVVGQATNAAYGALLTKQPYDDKVSVSPAIGAVDTSISAVTQPIKALGGESYDRNDVRDLFTFLGLMTGLPLGWAGRPAGYATGVAQGDIEPTSLADATRGLLTGTPSPESKTK